MTRHLITTLLTLFIAIVTQAQIRNVSGKVRDNEGNPLSGVLVAEVDSAERTIGAVRTDANGLYTLPIRNSKKNILSFTYEGYEPLYTKIDKKVIMARMDRKEELNIPPAPEKPVDLGLSVKWSEYNLGASSPKELGIYIAWGETAPRDNYVMSNMATTVQEICDSQNDAATVHWKGRWMTPTVNELNELIERCKWVWQDTGYHIIGPNGNSIFLPVSGSYDGHQLVGENKEGYYWSGNKQDTGTTSAGCLHFNIFDRHTKLSPCRTGMQLRPVWK